MQEHHRRHQDIHAEQRRTAHALPAANRALPEPDYLPLPIPDSASPIVVPQPSKILARDDGSDFSATSTCTSESDPGCKLPESAHSVQLSTIIGLSVALPVIAIIVVLFVLHRRSNRKVRDEDKKYADKDLDWGNDAPLKGKQGEVDYKQMNHKGHGMGMVSIDLGNPYMLPPDVHGSRDSLHSLSRSVTDNHDPYRMVQTPSIRSGRFGDAESKAESQRTLLSNSQAMSNSTSPLSRDPIARKAVPNPFASPDSEQTPVSGFDFGHNDHDEYTERAINVNAANRLSDPNKSLPATPANGRMSPPPRGDSKSPYAPNNNAGPVDPYSFQEVVVPPSPEAHPAIPELHAPVPAQPTINIENFPHPPPPEPEDKRQTLGLGLNLAGNRVSVLRPLPPDDPEENPEQRANRIRSFYKEYFSEGDARGYNAGADYYEDYGDEYLQDGAVFDPDSGQFIVAQAPYAEPVTRRAMTPPPRGPPPKFRGGPRRPGHMSSGSSPGVGGPRGRAYSNASTSRVGMGPGGPRGRAPKRPLPPPSALKNLPTPAMLNESSFSMTMDFAPPSGFADRAAGRPESPFMEDRPFAQKMIGSPLASPLTELAVVPSPHTLRKSGTFTALDFAPPPRFRDPDSMSDAGSIRSGRSNFSQNTARHQQNIRNGAYRVSRLPKGAVGTKFDIMNELKPKWDLGQ